MTTRQSNIVKKTVIFDSSLDCKRINNYMKFFIKKTSNNKSGRKLYIGAKQVIRIIITIEKTLLESSNNKYFNILFSLKGEENTRNN